MEPIRSRDNAAVKELTGLLGSKKHRDQSGRFALEGLRLCLDALESGLSIRALLLTPEAGERCPEAALLRSRAEKSLWITQELAARISDTQHPQGVFCVCDKLDNRESAVTIKNGGNYLLLEKLQDPGNLGTILRTAQAMGIDGVFAAGCPDFYSPKVLRAAMGGLFRLRAAVCEDIEKIIARLREAGVPVYAAALTKDAVPVTHMELSGGCAVLIGNEGSGLPDALTQACTGGVVIPMQPGANSLNAATAVAILLWEMGKGRLRTGDTARL